MKKTLKKITYFFQIFPTKIAKLLNFIFAILFYFLGIGSTKLVATLFAKKFLKHSFTESSWEKHPKIINLEKQY